MTRYLSGLIATLTVALAAAPGQNPPPPPPPGINPGDIEILARGPVHEAFAEPVDGAAHATPVVAVPPPPPIDEQPPDARPAGDDVQWIGGYWFWDHERNNHIWVSGCWRNEPPGRTWLPGRWQQVQNGFHWVSGNWVPDGQSQIELLPPPPPPVNEDLDGLAPADGHSAIEPGYWVWKNNAYAWRASKWVSEPADWLWQPATYTWTPGGYVFTDGYWDRPLRQRGLLFAGFAIRRDLATTRKVGFVPQHAVLPEFLETALFVRPAAGHYYFGDYFDLNYKKDGYIAWPEYLSNRGALDPLWAHARNYSAAPDWAKTTHFLYTARYAGQAPRPPRTLAQQDQYVRTVVKVVGPDFVPPPQVRQVAALTTIRVVGRAGLATQPVEKEQRAQYRRYAVEQAQATQAYQRQLYKVITDQGGKVYAPKTPYQVKLGTKVSRPVYLPKAPAGRGVPPSPNAPPPKK